MQEAKNQKTHPRVVVLIKDAENYKGSAVQMWHQVEALRERGVSIRVVAHAKRGAIRTQFLPNADFIRLPGEKSRNFYLNVENWLCDNMGTFDLIHVHGHGSLSQSADRVGRKFGIPVVVKVTSAGPGSRLASWESWGQRFPPLRRRFRRSAGFWVSISRESTRGLKAIGVGEQRIFQIPNGVAPIFCVPEPQARLRLRAENGLGENDFVLVTIGNLKPRKRIDLSLEAFAVASKIAPHLRFWIIGNGEDQEALQTLAQQRGVGDKVRFWGNIERPEVARALQSADAFVLTSQIEGLSNALLEAMRCGLAPVANFSSGNTDLITDGLSGRLVNATETATLAAIFAQWAQNPESAREMGAQAANSTANYALENVATQYEAMYQQVVSRFKTA